MPAPDGLLVVDKPAGWTSHDVVARGRRLCATRKVGHAGTLDPMATGVLVLGVGRATKLLTFLVGHDKAYAATVRLGQATLTDDAEGEVTASLGRGSLRADPGDGTVQRANSVPREVLAAVATLTGDIEQVPSAVSAIKVKGQRAYHRVRAGEDVQLPARPVTVSRFEVLATREDTAADGTPVLDVDVEVEVSSGTYVRALARDLGTALGTGGHLTALRRTRVGSITLEGAHHLADLEEAATAGGGEGVGIPVLPLADAARSTFVVRELTDDEAVAVGHGQRIPSAQPGRPEPVAAFAPDGRLVAVLDETGGRARTHVVFAPAGS